MKKKNIDKEIEIKLDELYDAVDCLLKDGHWNFINEYLSDLTVRIWRTDVNILLGWATSTLPAKSKLPARKYFLEQCKGMYSKKGLWDGLD